MSEKPKSIDVTPGPGFMFRDFSERLPHGLIAGFKAFNTADISDMLNRMYAMQGGIHNLANADDLLGSACTVKVFPGDNLMVHKALDIARPGDVIVVDASGGTSAAVLGDLIAMKAKHRGIAGVVTDGFIRDAEGVAEAGLPVYARGITPFGPLHRGPGEINYPISCGGVVVNPGDIVRGDADGVTVVPRAFADVVLQRLKDNQARVADYVADVRRGEFSNDWVDAELAASNVSQDPD
ncbi:MAG: hypothetical protein MI723_18230 [Caulobacterales bacterium]|nr:hypothetical protein [Caulobacterales bacterium]